MDKWNWRDPVFSGISPSFSIEKSSPSGPQASLHRLTDLTLFEKNILIDTDVFEKYIGLIGSGIIFSGFPVFIPETLPFIIDIPCLPSFRWTPRAGKLQVIPGIELI
jgi:hypothetical protein